MSTELARLFEARSGDNYLVVNADLHPPAELRFSIHSFGDGKDMSKERQDEWDWVGGVDAFYEFSLVGHVLTPRSIASTMCRVQINSLSSAESFERARSGNIGDGWLEDGLLLVRLWLARDATKDLIDYIFRYLPLLRRNDLGAEASIVEAQQRTNDPKSGVHRFDLLRQLQSEMVGHDEGMIHMRFDLTDVKAGSMPSGAVVSGFKVVRLYM